LRALPPALGAALQRGRCQEGALVLPGTLSDAATGWFVTAL